MQHPGQGIQEMAMMGYGHIPMAPTQAPNPDHAQLHGFASVTNEIDGRTFGETITNMIGKANDIMAQPEKLSIEAVTTGNVDIHEVMIALGKSEVAFKLMTAVTQKTIGGFDKLTSMQV